MICDLDIRDFISIERLALELSPGLLAVTGETGAGKSVFLSALEAAFGGPVRKDWVRRGADQASVTLRLILPQDHPAWDSVEASGGGTDRSEPLILRRVIRESGPSRAFVQDQPASAGALAEIGRLVSDFSTQHQQIELFRTSTHRPALDAFATLGNLVASVSEAWQAWQGAEAALASITQAARADAEAADQDRARLALVEQVAPKTGEVETLETERRQLRTLRRQAECLAEAHDAVSGDVEDRLLRAATALGSALRASETSEGLQQAATAVETALTMIQTAEAALADDLRELETATARLDEIDRRLMELKDAARRLDCAPEDLTQAWRALTRSVEEHGDGEGALKAAWRARDTAQQCYETAAGELRAARTAAAGELSTRVEAELRRLKLGHARFEVSLSSAEPGPTGMDEITFCLSTSPALAPVALRETASGGEVSRIALALKLVLADHREGQVHVFDEIDQGVGGAVATAMGERLKRLSRVGQVFIVTHSPQLAALADTHLRLRREIDAAGLGRTCVECLDAGSRVDEIARMVSGRRITPEARAAAGRLLGDGGSGHTRKRDRGLARAGA
jgi:DNA repair protein RecN (Recombination protein N)